MNIEDPDSLVMKKISKLKPPVGCGVIEKSTPVVSFGNFTESSIATLGINPSSEEFLSSGKLLPDEKKRLADEEHGPVTAIDVWFLCKHYFRNNPYWSWFGQLEEILLPLGASYKNNACHLDLSPWATDPIFRNLSPKQKGDLLEHDRDFLSWQLTNSTINSILFNGATVYKTINHVESFDLRKVSEIKYFSGGSPKSSDLIAGSGPNGVAVYGWTLNLQALQATVQERLDVVNQLVGWLNQDCKIDL